ncbi:MAG: S8 family serine peptidase, partial [Bacteroidota bacterium]
MKTRIGSGIALAVLLGVNPLGTTCAEAQSPHLMYEDQYVVEFDSAKRSTHSSTSSASAMTVVEYIGSGTAVISPPTARAALVTEPAKVPVSAHDTFCNDMIQAGEVTSCSPNYVLTASITPNDAAFGPNIFNPSTFDPMWGLGRSLGIDAETAWERSVGSDNVVVAVIDSGIDYRHPDLVDNLWRNTGEIPGNDIDDDRNGYIDDVFGINGTTGTGDPFDDNGHGTHVAGLIAARGDNGIGV